MVYIKLGITRVSRATTFGQYRLLFIFLFSGLDAVTLYVESYDIIHPRISKKLLDGWKKKKLFCRTEIVLQLCSFISIKAGLYYASCDPCITRIRFTNANAFRYIIIITTEPMSLATNWRIHTIVIFAVVIKTG